MKNNTFLKKLTTTWGVVGGGIAWMVHFFIIYALAEWGCLLNTPIWKGILSTNWLILIATGIFLIPASLACLASAKNSDPFLQKYGRWVNGIFIFFILAQVVPVFYFLEAC